ncbi:polysaccharide deacetylase family protein [Alteromonas ponticola]|uniref:Polysaccharide deacetylase family protein n=1 Tax=Alteromonas aquimaris TaxID=2998417 RepID=A0ABT3P3B9_9ALTE|nr:polysaccharide deacetylase family protein [Alteromonas aquimaris]MCW8107271.1 polysaccharide deacetylase family protein [Alteromonas aquimaris]
MKTMIKKFLHGIVGSIGWRIAKLGDKKLIILMYHRILPSSDERYRFEEPGMVVSYESFRMHMQVITDEGIPVVTPEAWLEKNENERPPVAIAITFDDGWLDNYQYAFPVLKEFGFVSTLFVVTDYLGCPAPFWPNRVLRLLLDKNSVISEEWHDLVNMMPSKPVLPMSRDEAAHVIASLKHYSDDDIYRALNKIPSSISGQIEMISADQLLEAKATMGVEVGCHTRRHYRLLEGLEESLLQEEIVESKEILKSIISEDPTTFCFPNGDYSSRALKMVRENYVAAVTTARGHNISGNVDKHQLVRIGVHNDISDTPLKFKARLSTFM